MVILKKVNTLTKTHEQFVEELKNINDQIEVLGSYTKARERIRVKCQVCGKEWEPLAYSLLQGRSCSHCRAIGGSKSHNGRTALKMDEVFKAQLKIIDKSIVVLGDYQNTHTNITCQCNRCNHIWSAKPYSLLQGHGCPRCAKSGTSFMEQFIRLCFVHVLGEENVLSRDRKLIGMELDIVLPAHKVAIEPGNWFLHQRSLDKDKQKQKKCAAQGFRLFTIYDKFPKGTKKPFDCITYEVDLNVADHSIIKALISELLDEIGIEYSFTEEEFALIEQKAYNLSKAMTHDNFVGKMKSIHPSILILGTFRNVNKRIKVKCETCGFEWNGLPANMLAGDGCRKCGTKIAHQKFIRDEASFVAEVAAVNPDVEIIGTYTGRHNPVQARCKICGYVWEPRASSLLRGSTHKGAKIIHAKSISEIEEKLLRNQVKK